MEIVNKKYLRIEKREIFMQSLAGLYSDNKERQSFFEEMISAILNYETNPNKIGKKQHLSLFLEEVYIPKEVISKYSFFDEKELYVKRSSIVNALLLAAINEEYDIAKELKKFLLDDSTRLDDLGDLKDYVLEHNINISDYFDLEKEIYIYNPIDNSISKGFIYSKDEIDKVKKRI